MPCNLQAVGRADQMVKLLSDHVCCASHLLILSYLCCCKAVADGGLTTVCTNDDDMRFPGNILKDLL